ncbi:Leucyl aminopeptidase (Aminopeptidase T) [Paracidovorax anthurii]|uniref:Crocagin biosynthetic protein CgnE/B domain-containing protein n=2 Tax=Paracidovorax anthurii TaxID=78229 RepID=A0A328ZL73_9BURK|nr:hypothetical protein [Paracidovorax anthurii]RAR86619.1 hypothetical protein AX018_1001206 [Paracidovorax anthurii]
MRDGLARNLRAVFSGEEALVVTDDAPVADWLGAAGVPATTFDDLLRPGRDMPRKVLAIPLDWERLPSRHALRGIFADASVLWMPLGSFSCDPAEARYALERFADIDITDAVAMNRRILSRLLLAPQAVSLSGPDTLLTVRLPDALQLLCRTRVGMLPDEHASFGNYFEVAMSPTDLSGHVDTELSVSGTLRIDSALVARHRELKSMPPGSFGEATALAHDLRRACPLQLSIRDNRIVDGLGPWARALQALCGPDNGSALTEVAVGTGLLPPENIDWSLNCLVNEGASGIHVGIGNGISGMHFDFISTEAHFDGT